jgi:hypothetical protein
LVVSVEGRLKQEEGRDPAGHVADLAGLFGAERTAEEVALAVGQPLLDDLISSFADLRTDRERPGGWHFRPGMVLEPPESHQSAAGVRIIPRG